MTTTAQAAGPVAEEFTSYTRLLHEAKNIVEGMKNRRVRYTPFGRTTEHTGHIVAVRPTGIMVRWDNPRGFWDGTTPHPIHPDDLAFT